MNEIITKAIWQRKFTYGQLVKESQWILLLLGFLNLFFGSLLLLFNKLGWEGVKTDYTFVFPGILYTVAGLFPSLWVRIVCICVWIFDIGYSNLISTNPKYWQVFFVIYAAIFVYKMIKYRKSSDFYIKFEKLDISLEHPFKIQIIKYFTNIAFLEWICIGALIIIFIFGGLVVPIIKVIHGNSPFFAVPLFAIVWFCLICIISYGFGWLFIGSNFPSKVQINDSVVKIEYPINWFNKIIMKENLVLNRFKILGVPIITIKDKKRILGIWLNEYLYHIILGNN